MSTDRAGSEADHAPSLKGRVTSWLDTARQRVGPFDHLIRTLDHYGKQQGSTLAGAVTYFAFLSFFPILALAFAVVGFVARYFPQAQVALVKALQQVLPGMIGSGKGQISMASMQGAAGAAAGIGIVVVLYSGLGWISGMRSAVVAMFNKPPRERPNFFVGKLRDLVALVVIGVVLLVSVAVSGIVRNLSATILGWFGLGDSLSWLLATIAVLVGIGANMVLFFAIFQLLGQPEAPHRALWSGALLGALGFEVLKQLSSFLLKSTSHSPAFQAFGIALILVVWIYYFSRVVMYAAAWAYTAPSARAPREAAETRRRQREARLARREARLEQRQRERAKGAAGTGFAAGSALTLGLFALARRRFRQGPDTD
ncbi:MAG: YihY/virulence factor BrkB family protein [Marmoricola sp.]